MSKFRSQRTDVVRMRENVKKSRQGGNKIEGEKQDKQTKRQRDESDEKEMREGWGKR